MSLPERGREIEVPETTTIAELASRAGLPATPLVRVGFEALGLLLTIDEALHFEQARVLLAHLGYAARREAP